MVCTSCFQATWVSSPSVCNSANWASSLASEAQPGRRPSPRLKATSYCFMMSQMSSKCSYRKLSLWCEMHHLAMIEPPRLTMPVMRLAVSGM